MKLAEAIDKYVAMKQVAGVSFRSGRDVLHALCRCLDDVAVASVTKGQISEFLETSASSERGWLYRYRILKAFFEHWLARNELTELPLAHSCRPRIARRAVPFVYSVSE